jgi:hypothetical protein
MGSVILNHSIWLCMDLGLLAIMDLRLLAICLGPVTAIIALWTTIHIFLNWFFEGKEIESSVWTAAKISVMLTIMFFLIYWLSEPVLWTN